MKADQIKSKYILLSLTVILGSALRIYGLDRSLWLDEVISVNRQKDIQGLVSGAHDQPLLYIILHFFMLFGNDEFTIRLPSVIFGVLGILLIYKVGEMFFGRPREGLIGAFLLAISTMHIQHSQEARYYALCTFLSLLSLFFFYKAVNENSKKLWFGFILSTVLVVLSHYYMFFVPLIEMLFLAFKLIKNPNSFIVSLRKIGKKTILLLILALIITSIFSLPILQRVLYYIEREIEIGRPWGLQPESFFQDLFSFFSFGFSFSSLPNLYGGVIAASFFYFFLLFFSLGIFTSIREYREQTVLLLLWVFLPATIVFLISFRLGSPVAAAKYLIFILPGYLLGISKGISSIANSLLNFNYKIIYGLSSIPLLERKQVVISSAIAMIIIATFAGISVVPLQKHYKSPNNYEDWKATVEYLENNSRTGDIIVVVPLPLRQCLFYYYEKNYSTADFMKNVTVSTGLFKEFKDITSKHDGVWLILSPRHLYYVHSTFLNWTKHESINVRSFKGVSIFYHHAELILIPIKNMSFIGLDSPPSEPVARFWHNDDSATFNVNISKASNNIIEIHARSGQAGRSALELVIDGASKGIKTFIGHEWSYVNLGTFYFDSGLHEIKLINRQGGDLGDTNILFDQVAIWPKQ